MKLRDVGRLLLGGDGLLSRDSARFLFGYVHRVRFQVLACVLLLAAQALLVLPGLWLVTYSVDTAIPHKRMDLLLAAAAALIALRLLTGFVAIGLRAWVLRLVKGVVSRLREDLIVGLYALARESSVFAEPDRIQTRIVQDTERVDNMCSSLLTNTLPAIVTSVCLTVYLLHADVRLLGLGIVAALLFWQLNRRLTRGIQAGVRGFQQAYEEFGSGVRFVLRHMDLTHLRVAEAEEAERQRARITGLRTAGEAMAMTFAWHGQVRTMATGTASGLLLAAGGAAIIADVLSLGQFMAFAMAAGMLNAYGRRVLDSLPDIANGSVSLATLRQLRAAGPLQPYQGSRTIDWTGRLDLRDVVVRYRDRAVLNGVSLQLDHRSNVALVGSNGAGKTTLLDVLLGFIRPESGRVDADGVAYDELDLGCLRRRIGVVPQHPDFFAGTIRDNLVYGLADRTDAEVDEAVRRARAGFVEHLPQRLETPIGEGGATLSGGERQRLAIARALLARPLLLVLDEPTNHLDAATIGQLMQGLAALPDRPALVTISHDPAVVALAERVFRLEAGRLTEERTAPIPAMSI